MKLSEANFELEGLDGDDFSFEILDELTDNNNAHTPSDLRNCEFADLNFSGQTHQRNDRPE